MADRIVLPPARRTFTSPSGRHVLTLLHDASGQSRLVQAQMQLKADDGTKTLWDRTLPHERGPRQVLVLDSGAVVLIDEWILVPSRYALMLLAPDGSQLAVFGIDDLVRLLGVSRCTVADHGRLGLWLSAAPTVSADGSTVLLRSAGRQLLLRLADGRLTAVD